MLPLVAHEDMDQIAGGIDHAEGICMTPDGTVIAAPTNCAFIGPDLDVVAVPNLGRWHVTRFRVPGLAGVPLFYPDDAALGAGAPSA